MPTTTTAEDRQMAINTKVATGVAKYVHDSIGSTIHGIMVADDKPASDLEILLAAIAGQLTALTTGIKALTGAGMLSSPLAKNLDAAVEGIGAQLGQSMKQTQDEHFDRDGHCGRKACRSCDMREEKRKAAMH